MTRKATANKKNGITGATTSRRGRRKATRLLYVYVDCFVPVAGNDGRGELQLVVGRKERLGVDVSGRKLGRQISRNCFTVDKVVVSNGMAIARQPDELAFIRIQVLHP